MLRLASFCQHCFQTGRSTKQSYPNTNVSFVASPYRSSSMTSLCAWQQVSHHAYSFYANERLTDIYASSILRPLIAHQPIAYLTIASLMLSTIYFTSSSVTYGPAGRQKPTLNSASSTPFVYTGAPSYTGCLCIGFHTGRHSIFLPSMNTRNASTFSLG